MSLYNVQTNEAMFINSREVAPTDGYSDMYGGNSSLSTTGNFDISTSRLTNILRSNRPFVSQAIPFSPLLAS